MFKLVVSDPKNKRSYQKEVEEKSSGLIGRKIGEKVKGDFLGLQGYELEITGGSDKQGFPMRPDVPGTARKRILLTGPPGFHPKRKGERRRKSVRGNTISLDIVQVNVKVVSYGKKSLEEIFGKKEKPKEEAKPEEKPKEEVKKEEPKEEKPETKKEEKPEEGMKEGEKGEKAEEEKKPEVPKEEEKVKEVPKEEIEKGGKPKPEEKVEAKKGEEKEVKAPAKEGTKKEPEEK
jgi:small subunit ribosomal protein S6e